MHNSSVTTTYQLPDSVSNVCCVAMSTQQNDTRRLALALSMWHRQLVSDITIQLHSYSLFLAIWIGGVLSREKTYTNNTWKYMKAVRQILWVEILKQFSEKKMCLKSCFHLLTVCANCASGCTWSSTNNRAECAVCNTGYMRDANNLNCISKSSCQCHHHHHHHHQQQQPQHFIQ